MNKNDTVILNITAVTEDGYGIGRHDGTVVFVPFAAVGDTVEVLIVKVKKSFCFGKLINIITPSIDRQAPDCAAFSKCGGCAFRHITYDAEKRLKRQRVADCMKRIGGLDIEVAPVESDGVINGYRNKSQYPVGVGKCGLVCGFYSLHSHRIVECSECKLVPESFEAIRSVILNWARTNGVKPYDESTGKGVLRHIFIRKAPATGQTAVCLIATVDRLPKEQDLINAVLNADENVCTIAVNVNTARTNVILGTKTRMIYGDGYITDKLCGLDFRIGINSFYQVNSGMAERLYKKAAELAIPDGKTVLDLYCGAGTIGLTMADRAKQIIGVEIVENAVKDAEYNAKINEITNARFICGGASEVADKLFLENIRPDIVIIDPPRKGLDLSLITTITEKFAPERVVYISCDPATLARDLKLFNSAGYITDVAYPFDLFPRTPHVECVVGMSRA